MPPCSFMVILILGLFSYLMGLTRYVVLVRDAENPPKLDKFCIVQSFWIIFSYLASYLWTIVIAFHIFISYMSGTDVTGRRVAHVCYHMICWGIPGKYVSWTKETQRNQMWIAAYSPKLVSLTIILNDMLNVIVMNTVDYVIPCRFLVTV